MFKINDRVEHRFFGTGTVTFTSKTIRYSNVKFPHGSYPVAFKELTRVENDA